MQNRQNSLTELVGKNIARRRKELGLTQEVLAERVGVGQQSLSRIEQGHMAPKFERLQMFADALEWSVMDLFRSGTDRQSGEMERIADLVRGLNEEQGELVVRHMESLVRVLLSK